MALWLALLVVFLAFVFGYRLGVINGRVQFAIRFLDGLSSLIDELAGHSLTSPFIDEQRERARRGEQ